ncbi:MAG TPA: hypothetical protein VN108_08245, partial [Marmoricola sp.]|nr:hypothetical protein [Marmoricola sp.]
MTTATWAIDRGFETISASNFQAAPDDAVWEPRRRGTTVQFLIPPFSIGLVGGLLAGVAGDSWADAVLGGFGFAVLLSCGF